MASAAPGTLDVFARGTDSALWGNHDGGGGGFTGWYALAVYCAEPARSLERPTPSKSATLLGRTLARVAVIPGGSPGPPRS